MTPQLSRLTHKLHRQEISSRNAWEPKLEAGFKEYGKRISQIFLVTAKRHGVKEPLKTPLVKAVDWEQMGDESMQDATTERISDIIKGLYINQYLAVAKETWATLDSTIGLGVMLTDPVEQVVIQKGGRRLGLIDLSTETRDAMFKAFGEGRELGWGADQLSTRIAQLVEAGPWKSAAIRARVIARTETKYAQNWSSLEAYRASDTITDVLVFDAQLGPTDEECEAINGETVGLEEAMALMESEHPNGTRSFAPVVT
jgi:hypothetical protein